MHNAEYGAHVHTLARTMLLANGAWLTIIIDMIRMAMEWRWDRYDFGRAICTNNNKNKIQFGRIIEFMVFCDILVECTMRTWMSLTFNIRNIAGNVHFQMNGMHEVKQIPRTRVGWLQRFIDDLRRKYDKRYLNQSQIVNQFLLHEGSFTRESGRWLMENIVGGQTAIV